MSAPVVDRNLLFGILALQMDFLSRDQLVAGMNAWVIDKEKPLGQILVGLGYLSEGRRHLLEPLVDEHVRQHDNDPARSLAALTSTGGGAESLRVIGDRELQESLGHVRGHSEAVGQVAPTLIHDGQSAFDKLRFRVLRPHARGGLGQVYVARDEELGRRVALKEIRNDRADDRELRSRFVLEAEINGNLEHPGIVPVYGLGTYPDGRPFYAMRFVEGDSLREAIVQFHAAGLQHDSLEFRQLLGRFVDVCEAIAYAHSRGVLHRDLKPDNVMLGKYGETLVVDWGLAKATGRRDADPEDFSEATLLPQSGESHDPTLAGRALGTPAFMSPEQAEGRLADLGPATDIYALGATLYQILVGKPPLESNDLGELLRRVIRGEILAPRSVNSRVPKALDAICRKAMALQPAGRYDTATSLAQDIERWLADEPITALRESAPELARRWVRKHRTLATTAGVLTLSILLGTAGFSVILGSKNRELDSKNSALDVANGELSARNEALASTNLALDQQRRRAEERELTAIDAVKRFRDAVVESEELMNDPALESLRAALLKQPIVFFQKLRQQLESDKETRPESLNRLSAATFDLGSLNEEIGDKQDAIDAYRQSIAVTTQLAEREPSQTEHQAQLAICFLNLGNLQRDTGQYHPALDSYESALSIQRKLVATRPADLEFRYDLSLMVENVGILKYYMGLPDAALVAFQECLSIRQRLVDETPGSNEYEGDLAMIQSNLASLLSETGKPELSMPLYEAAIALTKKQDESSLSLRDRSNLALFHSNLGSTLTELDRLDEAHRQQLEALKIREELVATHPTVTSYQRDLASTYDSLGHNLEKRGQLKEAVEPFEKSLAILERLANTHPDVPTFASDLGNTLSNMAVVDFKSGRLLAAQKKLQQAAIWQAKALAVNPNHLNLQHHLIKHLRRLGRTTGAPGS